MDLNMGILLQDKPSNSLTCSLNCIYLKKIGCNRPLKAAIFLQLLLTVAAETDSKIGSTN